MPYSPVLFYLDVNIEEEWVIKNPENHLFKNRQYDT
jgi:hypothetical protein